MSRHRYEREVVYESDSSDYGPPIHVERANHRNSVLRVASDHGSRKSRNIHRDSSPAPVVVENNLLVPQQHRPRASSTGGAPAPIFVPVYQPPHRHRSRSRSYYSSDSDDYHSSSRGRRRPSSYLSPDTQQQLAKLKLMEDEKQREALEQAALAKHEEKLRRDKEREKQIILEAESRRKKEEADRALILAEERDKAEKKKKADEELRKKILHDEEDRIKKEKEKKKKEEEEFQHKVKERFMKAGYSPEYIDDILAEKKKEKALISVRDELAIDLSRPTYIRVQRKYLYPDTLDFYGLPWEYDSSDNKYIIIKKYISHDLQQELFRHTQKIMVRKDTKMITGGVVTGGFTKETTTTLKPGISRLGDSDEMYIVRRKSTSKTGRSRSRSRSWMFT